MSKVGTGTVINSFGSATLIGALCCVQVKQHYGEESEEGEDSGVKGYMDLITFLDKVRLREISLLRDHGVEFRAQFCGFVLYGAWT